MKKGADNIYSQPMQSVDDFRFDDRVVDVFPDMIQRSVPGYQTIIHTIGELASKYVSDGSCVYDLAWVSGPQNAKKYTLRKTYRTP